jgi:hypothetical protein
MDRRKFFKTTAISAAGLSLAPKGVLRAKEKAGSGYFGVNDFIENNPDAVFIMRTDVDKKTNSAKIYSTGVEFAKSVLIPKEDGENGAIPVSNFIAIKPNITLRFNFDEHYTVEGTMGIVTDAFFVEGFVERLKEFGVDNKKIHLIETNYNGDDLVDGGYIDMVNRTGINLKDLSSGVGGISEDDIVWQNVINGTYFKKIPYIFPVNAPNSWLLNIAKLKAHSMGITSCAKNLQGTIVKNYQEHCRRITDGNPSDVPDEHLVPDRKDKIIANYFKHCDTIPRWNRPGDQGGIWQETWATRCLDNNSTINVGLHIIEGIYGRDGNFIKGPSKGDNVKEGFATDYMSNVIIFGKNPFNVDNIAHWIAGHEPGNFGLFHMAIERGLASELNPMKIPVYEWKSDGTATLTPLTEFTRTPLKTKYLQRDYDEQEEYLWHLCDEPYAYDPDAVEEEKSEIPDAYNLKQNYPNPFNPSTKIEFSISKAGHTNLSVYNERGQKVATILNKNLEAGNYSYDFDASSINLQLPSGRYFYRLESAGYSKTKKMVLTK